MIGNITSILPQKLFDYLRPGAPALMLTTGADGYPTSAYTWVVSMDNKRLRFGVDQGGSAMTNLQRTGQASIQIIGPDDVSYLVKGKSRQIKEQIAASAPASIMLFEMDVMGAKDQSWTGVSTTALRYEWPAEQREAMLKMEQAVYAEMRDFAGSQHPLPAELGCGRRVIPEAPADMAIYAIGDIHGRLDLLDAIHRSIAEDAASLAARTRLLIYLGDYVSRGPDSRGVVERIREWLPRGFKRIALKGNHEDLLLRCHAGEVEAARHWLDYGGIEALASYGIEVSDRQCRDETGIADMCHSFAAALPASHLEFYRGLQISHRVGDYCFVHGGVRPGVALDDQNPRDCMWIRKAFLHSDAVHGAVIVHGHSISHAPEERPNRIGIDTGAYHSGVLTCLVLEGSQRRFLQTRLL